MEAIGLIVLGLLMLGSAPFGDYHDSWKSPWQVAGWGLICVAAGPAILAWELRQ